MLRSSCAPRSTRRRLAAVTLCASMALAGTTVAAAPADASVLGGLLGTITNALRDVLAPVGIWGDAQADKVANRSGSYSSSADPGSLYTIENAIGARAVWAQKDATRRQITGQGVGVAVLDTGIAAVPGLDVAGKVVEGPDLSIEGNGVNADTDGFGHGTHLAAIIGAHDPAELSAAAIPKLDPATQLGVAPDATLEAIKLGTRDGSADVSQIIAGLDWVTQHPNLPDGSRVRVVNLAFGTDSVQPYQIDPLAAAAENAWKHGLVVIVSGGNEGPTAHGLTDPAIDPYVIAVGASDGNDSVAGWNDPDVASFSSSGTSQRHVDLLAPGRSIASLHVPGSFVDANHPEGRVAGDTTGRLFRGSGTSQAAAVVSGAVALLLQAYPDLTPDQVKYVLTRTATPMPYSAVYAGAGQLDVSAALGSLRGSTGLLGLVGSLLGGGGTARATQSFAGSTGQGSIEAARGGDHLVDADGTVLSGEIDAQGNPWRPAQWWAADRAAAAWSGGSWNGAVWTGSAWASTGEWDSARWDSARWDSARWDSARWDDADWDSARWDSARWDSARWDSAYWDSARWDSARWDSSAWN